MILHQISPARVADDADLSDLTSATRNGRARFFECEEHGTADCLLIPLDAEPTVEEETAIRDRLVTADEGDEARLKNLKALRKSAATPFEVMWLDTELGKYGEASG